MRIQVRAKQKVKQKVWNKPENREGDWGDASHVLRVCEACALRARKTLTPPFTDFFTDFEKKTDCFAVHVDREVAVNGGSTVVILERPNIKLEEENRQQSGLYMRSDLKTNFALILCYLYPGCLNGTFPIINVAIQ